MSNIDQDRISLMQTLAWFEKEKHQELFVPINPADVPMYSTSELKSVTVDVTSEQNDEKLVDMRSYGLRTLPYYREEAQNNPTYNTNIAGAPDVIYARTGVCEKMQEVNRLLEPLGLELIVYDAHRSPATQKKLYMHFLRVAEEKGLEGQAAHDLASQYCSNPDGFDKSNPKTWTMHSTGAAVDVYLFDKKSGKVIDMGEGYFDNPSDVTNTQYYEEKAKQQNLTKEQESAMYARRVLFNAMKEAGFYNYGSELFHYEYKGLIEAKVQTVETGRPVTASYGYVQSPADNSKANILAGLLRSKSYS